MHSPSSPISEFDLIERFFKTGMASNITNPSLSLGIGDDCALIKTQPGEEIAITSDMLVEGRHFFSGADPELLGFKALAVNLSDLAAMGRTIDSGIGEEDLHAALGAGQFEIRAGAYPGREAGFDAVEDIVVELLEGWGGRR